MIRIENLSGGYDTRRVIQDLSFEVAKGEILGILGPNGSGKSTLMKFMSGVLTPSHGEIYLNDRNIRDFRQKELAQKVSVLPQFQGNTFDYTVRETIELGRYPFRKGFFHDWTEEDERAVTSAIEQMELARFEHVSIDSLSGGERQRVFLAQALAQTPEILLLDEPTNHLDIAHQKQLLDTVRNLSKTSGVTIIGIFHDINLASLYCDKLLLLQNGSIAHYGEPHEVINSRNIDQIYQARIITHPHPEMPKPQITLMPGIKRSEPMTLSISDFTCTDDYVLLQTAHPWKTLSSAINGAGIGWAKTFVNRCVAPNYTHANVETEMEQYLLEHHFVPTETMAMMTAISPHKAVIKQYSGTEFVVTVMVTAGIGNAMDVSKSHMQNRTAPVGTINTWVLIEGHLREEAFIEAMITSTEAKAKALQIAEVLDPVTRTIATGTPTDSLLIAGSQQGIDIPFAGPATEVGKIIGKGVYEATLEAIYTYRQKTSTL
ncbi:adenosylcobinamide amidohydrolase [Paenisporosarcina cavernae]|uniref:ATP-binding cassette domain-containing protein n=1 Tax=Paenisporosarcina cavernae TaxID=2320858 RepID=A0A385YS28_9BACL|nr:adenosylcobinamide amidohydrolase [Paenisporosarcina cavernae]AYC28797.1 ATP-binding cassette domain-containing protein [Paenisporosarcina cavernae]